MTMQVDVSGAMAVQKAGQSANISNNTFSKLNASYTERTDRTFKLPNGVADQDVDLGMTTCKEFALVSTQALLVKLNGDTAGFLTEGTIISGTEITEIKLSNASGSEAEVQLLMAGE